MLFNQHDRVNVHRPAADGNPDLQSRIHHFQIGQTRVQLPVGVDHGRHLEGVGVDEGKCEVEMSVGTRYEILGEDGAAWSSDAPSFKIPNRPL